MKDPWRVAPQTTKKVRQEAGPKAQKINPGERDIDADIRPRRTCPIRFKRCTFEICSSEIETLDDALRLLAACVASLRSVGLGPALDAERIGTGLSVDRPRDASSIASAATAIWFIGRSLDEGTLALARLLSTASRHPQAGPLLRKYGVRAMLRA